MIDIIKNNQELVIVLTALFSAITASFSIILTFLSLKHQRTHSELSIRPLARISTLNYNSSLRLKLTNSGLGPLIVKEFKVYQNGEHLNGDRIFSFLPTAPNELWWRTFTACPPGLAINSQKTISLLDLNIDTEDQCATKYASRVRKTLSEMKIILKYTDLYGSSEFTAEKDLSWYGDMHCLNETDALE